MNNWCEIMKSKTEELVVSYTFLGIKTDPRWQFYWISMVLVGNVWKEVDTNNSVSWLNWLPSEPNVKGGEENCGSVIYSPSWLSWGWNDISCEGKLLTICEINRN